MILYPKDFTEEMKTEAVKTSNELVIDDVKKEQLILKSIEILGETPKRKDEIVKELEQYCVFTLGEHYTSSQLTNIVDEMDKQNHPLKEVILEVPLEKPTPIIK